MTPKEQRAFELKLLQQSFMAQAKEFLDNPGNLNIARLTLMIGEYVEKYDALKREVTP